MSRYRRVETRTWLDETFRSFSAPQPNAQTLWLYLLCGPRTTIFPGLIVAREEVMASDLGWDLEGFRKALVEACGERLGEPFAKVRAKVDRRAGVVVLLRALLDSHGDPRESTKPANPNILKSWSREWDQIPECRLKDEYLIGLKAYCDKLAETYPKAFMECLGKPYAKACLNQEQYQEQEQEEEKGSPALALLKSKVDTATGDVGRQRNRVAAKAHPDQQRVIDSFHTRFKAKYGTKPTWDGKTIGQVGRLLGKHTADVLEQRMDFMFAGKAKWPPGPYSLSVFVTNIDRWVDDRQPELRSIQEL